VRAARAAVLVVLWCAALAGGGCATRDFSVRTLPAETPAADNAAAIKRVGALTAPPPQTTAPPGEPLTAADVPSMDTYDPWERLNRFTYRFNARFDQVAFLPVADTYRRLPGPLRAGVHNFFGNLSEVVSVVNYVVQLRPLPGAKSLGRFVINSTLGIGGLFDVATPLAHLPAAPTGFGATLARYGMHPGPYLVLPILGPSTLRDGAGWGVDYGTNYAINLFHLYRGEAGWILTPLDAIDIRANTAFRYYSTGSPFEYETVRFLYVRKTLIEDDALRLWHRSGETHPNVPAGR
jgi:phospholipid-binding lipoprotein MlaA